MSHRGFLTRMASLLALSGATLAGSHAYAQDNATDAGAQPAVVDASTANTNDLAEVVVTGTAAGTRKIDASFEITTTSLAEIRDASPLSSADLLKVVPGLWAESSGGPTGANIEIAGLERRPVEGREVVIHIELIVRIGEAHNRLTIVPF